MKLKKVLEKNSEVFGSVTLEQLFKKTPARQIDTVRSAAFWADLSTDGEIDSFLSGFIDLPQNTQVNALLNPQMWQAIEPRLISRTGKPTIKGGLTAEIKRHIETILRHQSKETLNYIFLMPSFLQLLSLNDFHSDYILDLKLSKLKNNVAGTSQEKKIYARLFDTLFKMPQGRKLLEEGITCFQTRYLFDTSARNCAHWQKELKLCSVSKINSPLDEIESNPAMLQYATDHLLHELYHMNQYDSGCQQKTGASKFENFVAYRLLELETAVLNALPHNGQNISYQDTPAKKRPLYFMKKYMSWLIEQNGGDEKKAKTAFAKHLWSNKPNDIFEDASKIRKIFTSWNKQYNLKALQALNRPFTADVQKCVARLKTHMGINIPTAYFLDNQNMSLNIEVPAQPYLQGPIFNTLQMLENLEKDAAKSDRFLIAALSMEKAPQMILGSFLNKMFEYCVNKYEETHKKMYLKGILHILSAENFQDTKKLEKVKGNLLLQKYLDSLRTKKACSVPLQPSRSR